MTTGARIREAREQRDLTQERLARMAEVSLVTVSRWERDKHKPFPKQMAAIAEVLGVDVDWLTQDEEKEAVDAAMLGHVENIAAAIAAALGVAMVAKQAGAEPERVRVPRIGEPGRPSYHPSIEPAAAE